MAIRKAAKSPAVIAYDSLFADVTRLLETSQQAAGRTVNTIMTVTYWQIGRRIVEEDQRGEARALYGDELMYRLAEDLSERFGRGYSQSNLFQMRQFYSEYRNIFQTVSGKSASRRIFQTVSGKSASRRIFQTPSGKSLAASALPLSWSHYVRLMTVDEKTARSYYEVEALRGGWSVRELDRQISTQAYERLRRKKPLAIAKPQRIEAENEIRDPFVLEFLGLEGEFDESDLEAALTRDLEKLLLEMGNDFTFVARQRRMRIGTAWYKIDLLFFSRKLQCLVVVDLKIGKFTHSDAGQMNLYLNYAKEHWALPHENPPVGLVLCSEQDSAVAHYSLDGLANTVMARQYKLALPDEKRLARRLEETRLRLIGPRK